MWNIGSTQISVSFSQSCPAPLICERFATRLRCVSITPLQTPVVPLE